VTREESLAEALQIQVTSGRDTHDRRRHVSSSSSPVDVDVLVLLVCREEDERKRMNTARSGTRLNDGAAPQRTLLAQELGKDLERVSTKVVALGLEERRREALGPVAVKERQRGRERRGRDSPQRRLGDNTAPSCFKRARGQHEREEGGAHEDEDVDGGDDEPGWALWMALLKKSSKSKFSSLGFLV
jgi:hypothetical protein